MELERINGQYIINEVSSVLNFNKGILYTVRELILRPGTCVREFIQEDRNRIVKPIIFLIFSSLIFTVAQHIFKFDTGTYQDELKSHGVNTVFEWVGQNFGFANILLGIFIGLWTKLFFRRSGINIYEILILIFFTIGIGNLIYTLSGILESTTGLQNNNLTYLIGLVYSAWAVGNFFNKNKIISYFKGLLAYFLGTSTGSFLFILIGILIDVFNKSS